MPTKTWNIGGVIRVRVQERVLSASKDSIELGLVRNSREWPDSKVAIFFGPWSKGLILGHKERVSLIIRFVIVVLV